MSNDDRPTGGNVTWNDLHVVWTPQDVVDAREAFARHADEAIALTKAMDYHPASRWKQAREAFLAAQSDDCVLDGNPDAATDDDRVAPVVDLFTKRVR